jgi:hypothetical protein
VGNSGEAERDSGYPLTTHFRWRLGEWMRPAMERTDVKVEVLKRALAHSRQAPLKDRD